MPGSGTPPRGTPALPEALNQGFRHEEQIGPDAAGCSVLAHLQTRYPHASEALWRERIHSGQVRLDGLPAEESHLLRCGQHLRWERPPWAEPDAPCATAVLFEDRAMLVLAKPSGLPTLPGGGFQDRTLLAQARRRHPEASPMHRLGRATSGLVLFAPSIEARKPLQAAFRQPQTRKIYRALCAGEPLHDAFEIDASIGSVPYPPLGTLHAACPEGRRSRSRVTVLERRGASSLLEVEIFSGRPHQIRIHLAFAGHPLAGDPLYGPGGLPLPGTQALPGDPGYLLHAHQLELAHPQTGARIILHCQPPPPLRTQVSLAPSPWETLPDSLHGDGTKP